MIILVMVVMTLTVVLVTDMVLMKWSTFVMVMALTSPLQCLNIHAMIVLNTEMH